MGIFTTTTSLETDWTQAPFTNLTALAADVITESEREIRKVLSNRYDVSAAAFQTSTSTPPMVTTICRWMALGLLYERTARGSTEAYTRADRFLTKAMKNLEDIAERKYNLVDSSGDIITEGDNTGQIKSSSSGYHDTFNEDSPLNWGIDGDKIDDINDERD